MRRCDVLIVGSGFGGSLLARVLRRLGRDVVLVERGRHPRFALGESSTPLADLALERLARRYSLDDLDDLAAYGRWRRRFPEIRHGLKRGFTFYGHRPGEPYRNGPENDRRLLVAASPSDEVADSHWLREDVDAFLVERARAEGVDYRDQVELDAVAEEAGAIRVAGRRRGRPLALRARLLLDASGGRGFLARRLPITERRASGVFATALVYGHFAGVRDFAEVARAEGAALDPGPYPDDRAAVHHLLRDAWMYVLPFDHGVASAGFVLRRSPASRALLARGAEVAWSALLAEYPSLARQFAAARPVRPLGLVERLPYRLRRAAGAAWLLLPHAYAFFDPLYSTGIAWTLLAVERLGLLFEEAGAGNVPPPAALRRYAALLSREADRAADLVTGAYLAMDDFATFAVHSLLYFAAVSYEEAWQRQQPEENASPHAWRGFLGAGDPVLDGVFAESVRRLRSRRRGFAAWARGAIAPRNVAGLGDPARRNLYDCTGGRGR